MEFVDAALLELDAEKLQRACFKNKVRMDGRGFLQHRRVTVQPSYIKAPRIVGSALVQIGGTMCVAGVNIMVGEPSQENPCCGDVVTTVALMAPGGGVALGAGGGSSSGASSAIGDVHRGVTEAAAAQAEEAVAHAVRGLLDLGQLSILRGKFAYRLCVDVTCLCNEGGLDEAAVLAAVAALRNTQLPHPVVVDGAVHIDRSRLRALQLRHCSVCVSLGLFDGQLLVDPSHKEQNICHSSVTCVFALPSGCLKYVTQSSAEGLDPARLQEAVSVCRSNAEQIVQSLKWS